MSGKETLYLRRRWHQERRTFCVPSQHLHSCLRAAQACRELMQQRTSDNRRAAIMNPLSNGDTMKVQMLRIGVEIGVMSNNGDYPAKLRPCLFRHLVHPEHLRLASRNGHGEHLSSCKCQVFTMFSTPRCIQWLYGRTVSIRRRRPRNTCMLHACRAAPSRSRIRRPVNNVLYLI